MNIAVLDIETTGRNPGNGTIVEIGICLLNLETHYISKLLDTTVRELDFETKHEARQLKDCWVFNNSSLTIEKVKSGPSWVEMKGKIQRILSTFPSTAYNKQFDFGFLKDRGIHLKKELQCPMIAATPVLKIPGKYGDYKWPSVEEAWEYLFSTHGYDEAHRAYDDAVHEAEIVYELYKRGAWKL